MRDMAQQQRIAIVDDHPLFRGALRQALSDAIEKLSSASVILQHFADQISRRPLRFLTGVTPPADSAAPPDTSREQ